MNQTTPGGIALFLPLILISLLFLPPVARILRRTGNSPWLCLIALIPLAWIIHDFSGGKRKGALKDR